MSDFPSGPIPTRYSIAELRRNTADPNVVTLYLDGAESSALDLNDPHYLEFEYMQHMRSIIDSVWAVPAPLRVLHLGAAACALARALDADRPGSRQLAIEIDPELATNVRSWFDLPPSPRLRIRADEARRALEMTHATWDVIVRDAFIHRDVPIQLRTAECTQRAHDVLHSDGIYVVNSIATHGLHRFDEELATLASVFPHMLAIVDPSVVRGHHMGNIVIAAGRRPFDETEISRRIRRLPLPAVILPEDALRKRARGARALHDVA
ncbi:MAG: fused MFS/spermidine synthase [Ancrocorticia sp.]|nr:fused MFS/spermidine synthase [Ancrocorticia sp.]